MFSSWLFVHIKSLWSCRCMNLQFLWNFYNQQYYQAQFSESDTSHLSIIYITMRKIIQIVLIMVLIKYSLSSACGNGVLQLPQECDDGNSINGDGCSEKCTVEKDFDCANLPDVPSVCCQRPFLFYDPSTRSCVGRAICGDGGLEPGEECDDGNWKQGDGCTEDCKVENGFNCTNVTYQRSVCCKNTVQVYDNSTNKCKYTAICQNGVFQVPQECDDGNDRNGDGCSANCTVEIDFNCADKPNLPSVCCQKLFQIYDNLAHKCNNTRHCGDRGLQVGEECDDGNLNFGDGCSSNCTIEEGFQCTNELYKTSVCCKKIVQVYDNSTKTCKFNATCGNKLVEVPQDCDDGNKINGDGCNENCTIEQDFNCANQPSVASVCCRKKFQIYDNDTKKCKSVTICGDGQLQEGEECDDGNYSPGDGCYNCTIENGFYCTNQSYQKSICCKKILQIYNTTTKSCQINQTCGNGVLQGSEQCDDQNIANGDGCSSNCSVQIGYQCNKGLSKSICCLNLTKVFNATVDSCSNRYFCSNGIIEAGQDCDDGNKEDGDGCSSVCKIEPGYDCVSVSGRSVCCGPGLYYSLQSQLCEIANFVLTSYFKDPYANSFQLVFTNKASNRLLFEVQGIKISTNFPYESVSSSFSSNTLTLTFAYNTSLNDASLAVTLSGQTVVLPSVTDNNLSLKHYSSQDYSVHSFLMAFVPIFTYAALALLALTFVFVSKAVAVETLLVLQFAYGGLLMVRKMEAGMHAYRALSLFNGYNASADDGTKVPPRVEGLDLSADFLSNFNYELIVCLLPTVVGATLFLVHAVLKRLKRRSALQPYAASALGEWQLSALLVCAQQFVFAFVINIQYSRSPTAGIVVGALLLLLYAFNGYRFCDKSKASSYGEFKKGVQAHSCNLYAFALAYRLSLSVILVAAESVLAQSLSLAWTVAWAAFVLVRRPYKKFLIPIINSILMVLTTIFYLYQITKVDSPEVNFATYIPILLILTLATSVLFNLTISGVNYYRIRMHASKLKAMTLSKGQQISKDQIKLQIKSQTNQNITEQGSQMNSEQIQNISKLIEIIRQQNEKQERPSTDIKNISAIKKVEISQNSQMIFMNPKETDHEKSFSQFGRADSHIKTQTV